jgi:hypothetical protein
MMVGLLVALLAQDPAPASLLLVSGPTTHEDGSVTWNPPARYDHPFDGRETVYRLPQDQVPSACRELFKKAGLDIKVSENQKGCAAYKGKIGYIIVIDSPFQGVTPEDAIRHERGHLNGWPSDHSE